jgi:alkylhydroperoxidase family enzyme
MRPELTHAQIQVWSRLADPGTWWTASQRIAIAAESRNATHCKLCKDRAVALSPFATTGTHTTASTTLPEPAVEAIHRIRTDSGRIGEAWFLGLQAAGLPEEAYVELVSIVAVVTAIDTFRRAAGLPIETLPTPGSGTPSGRRPAGAKPGLGWVATLAPEDREAHDPDLYGDDPGPRQRPGANIQRALSLVPGSMIHWWDLMEAMYQSSQQMRDFSREYRAISHAQIELLAARVAAINRCEY